MLWGNIIKAIPFVLQVILVVVSVALFAFFDPFGIFIQARSTLKDTPVDVRSIREIGVLITAEYYGEVISSYAHEIEEKQDTSRQIYRKQMLELLSYYIQEINELNDLFKVGDLKRKDIYKAYTSAFSEVNNNPEFEILIYYIANKSNFKAKHLDARLNLGKKKNLIRNAVKSGYDSNDPITNPGYLNSLFEVYEQTLQKEKTKRLKKKNLVLLGRGWVKAGFDFGSFTEQNFKYDKVNRNIYFIGFKPEIISATINPWFIPEEGVEGFEFLVVERKSRRDYKVVQLVKQRCLDELVRKAHEREIMLKAIENARESLKEFFSLVMNEEINRVIFFDNELDYTYSEIVKNDTITGEELLLIDHLLNKQALEGIRTEDLADAKNTFIDSLKQTSAALMILRNQDVESWTPELTIAYAVCRDGIFDEYQDAQMIRDFSMRYCAFDSSIHSLKYSCENLVNNTHWIVNNTNIFVARNTETIAGIGSEFDASLIDSLFTADDAFSGISIGISANQKFDSLLLKRIELACSDCE